MEPTQESGNGTQQPINSIPKPISRRAAKAATLPGEKGSDGKAKGQTREDEGGQLKYRANEEHSWQPAVYHDTLRKKFIDMMSQLGSYDYPRAHGQHENDITSFLPEQKSWYLGDDRDAWHDILHCFVYKGYPIPDYDPGFMYDEGRIVLDLENRPIKNWREIPLTCSSELEGMIMEIICRQNSFISSEDFRARMPRTRIQHGAARAQYASSTINMHKTRFRQQAGLVAWTARAGTLETRRYLETIIPQPMVAANWTRGWVGPTKAQQKRLQAVSRGQYPERATGRNVSPGARNQRDATEQRRLAMLEAKEATKSPVVDRPSTQRSNMPVFHDDLQASNTAAQFSAADSDTLSDGRELSGATIESVLQKIKSPQAFVLSQSEWVAYTNGSISAQDLIPIQTLDFTTLRIVVIPIWVRDHWTLAVIDFIDENVRILDSSNDLDAIAWAFISTRSVTSSPTFPNGLPLHKSFSTQHDNQHDSGLWVLANAEAIFKGELLPEAIDASAARARYRSLVADRPNLQQHHSRPLPIRQSRKRERSLEDDMELDHVKPRSRKRRTAAVENTYTGLQLADDFNNHNAETFTIDDSDYQFPYPNVRKHNDLSEQPSQPTNTELATIDPSLASLDDQEYLTNQQKLHKESLAFLEETNSQMSISNSEPVDNDDADPFAHS